MLGGRMLRLNSGEVEADWRDSWVIPVTAADRLVSAQVSVTLHAALQGPTPRTGCTGRGSDTLNLGFSADLSRLLDTGTDIHQLLSGYLPIQDLKVGYHRGTITCSNERPMSCDGAWVFGGRSCIHMYSVLIVTPHIDLLHRTLISIHLNQTLT